MTKSELWKNRHYAKCCVPPFFRQDVKDTHTQTHSKKELYANTLPLDAISFNLYRVSTFVDVYGSQTFPFCFLLYCGGVWCSMELQSPYVSNFVQSEVTEAASAAWPNEIQEGSSQKMFLSFFRFCISLGFLVFYDIVYINWKIVIRWRQSSHIHKNQCLHFPSEWRIVLWTFIIILMISKKKK